jgi:hypothetical protein
MVSRVLMVTRFLASADFRPFDALVEEGSIRYKVSTNV